ncbi:MAG: T9SS type A sorting domain-containing protein [Flavobacteriales bacterium]|nr:T9SS type A sorting domain-containing protein [Flavobacteriales bacterium]
MKRLIPLLILFSISTQAQELLHCGADEMRIQTLQANPKIAEAVIERDAQLEAFTREYAEATLREHFDRLSVTPQGMLRGGQVYTIPVVYHVIHKYGNENISEEQLMDGLRILNETFRKTREDTAEIHEDFKPIHADCEIEFKLATKDPEGNCHSGINRIASSLTNSGDHRVKELIHWDPTMYLNVYVVSNAAGLAGHCVWPADADTIPEWDGIVIGHSYVGTIGTSDLTRSVAFAHECGHYLNLHHIWGGNNVPNFYYLPVGQQSNCGEDDLVGDTPNTIGWSNCNLNAASCGNVRDNVQNAMDYTYCNIMFTEGQKTRMHACLNSSIAGRNNLWSPANLAATGVMPSAGFCAADFTADNTFICNPSGGAVNFSNTSFHGEIDSVHWTLPGGDSPFSVIENPTVVYYQPGSFNVSLTAYSNGQSQSVTKSNYITVLSDSAWSFPFMEWFGENTSLDGSRWFGRSLESEENWQITDQAYYSTDHSLLMDNWNNPLLSVNELYSPPIDLSAVSSTRLAFKYAYSGVETPSNSTKLQLQVSNNCETNWTTRLTISGSSLLSEPIQNEPFLPNINEWVQESINLPSTYLVDGFRFRFVFTSEGNDRLFLDDVNVDVTAGTAEDELGAFSIYPNPATHQLTIALADRPTEQNFLELMDSQGRLLVSKSLNGADTFRFDISAFSAGVYLIRISDERSTRAQRFIIN